MQMYIASAGDSDPNGIVRCELNAETGKIRQIDTYDTITDCLYLALHPSLPLLYAVGGGEIVAFRVADDGRLFPLNRQSTGGYEPCYVSVTNDGNYALVVNYAGPDGAGTIVLFPLRKDGGVHPASDVVSPTSDRTGPHPTRQDAPHPHMIVPVPGDDRILVPDLGTDRVLVYTAQKVGGERNLTLADHVEIQAGSGPRHLAFHPTERVFYVLSELEPLVTVVDYSQPDSFGVITSHTTLPPGETKPKNNLGADIHVTPSGRFLYASNRGHDSLAIFAISDDGRTLDYVAHESTQGHWPRGFMLDPEGHWLVAANQYSNDLYTFRIDHNNGRLTSTGYSLSVSAPVCARFTNASIA